MLGVLKREQGFYVSSTPIAAAAVASKVAGHIATPTAFVVVASLMATRGDDNSRKEANKDDGGRSPLQHQQWTTSCFDCTFHQLGEQFGRTRVKLHLARLPLET